MGREVVQVTITASLSAHNSPEDAEDEALWGELCQRVRAVTDDPKYARVLVMTNGLQYD